MARLQVIKGGETLGMGLADYVWISEDGLLGFKKKTILIGKNAKGEPIPMVQRWTLANCECKSYCEDLDKNCQSRKTYILSPCFFLPDPIRPQPNYIVLCEFRDLEDKCLATNYRSHLRKALTARGPTSRLIWFGFEQNYVLQNIDNEDTPALAERAFLTSERHLGACFDAGLMIHSAWNQPGTYPWDFKVGVRGFPQDLDPDPPNALTVCDHLMVAHYLMHKAGGEKGLEPEWRDLSIFVSTPELREPGADAEVQAQLLMNRLDPLGHDLRKLPHPINGGYQCIEVSALDFRNPYKLALDVLEAVWPLDHESPITDDDEDESA